MKKVEYKNWPNCIRLANKNIELVATTDIGPRIIYLGFIGGQNFFRNFESQTGKTGGEEWRIYGGHRLWHAPEIDPRTYSPDNDPVDCHWERDTLTLSQRTERLTGIQKILEITLDEKDTVTVRHRLINHNQWAISLAPWAISVMAQEGVAVIPQEEYRPHPECLQPARPLVLWHYTDMSDQRWTWGKKYILLEQSPQAKSKQKVGMLNKQGWCSYLLNNEVMLKDYCCHPEAPHADYGCNTEVYTDSDFLEIETLGPMTTLAPGFSVIHEERWLLSRTECGKTEDDIDRKILPLRAKMRT